MDKALIFSREELEKLCREWQGILRLNDWDITILIDRKYNFELTNVWGECKAFLCDKEAFIRIIDPIDINSLFRFDMEELLIHELLHCHFKPFEAEDGTLEDKLQEQVIQTLAKSLLNLKRKVVT